METTEQKSPLIVVLLCLFFGLFGAHRFYVKKYGTGFLMLITLGAFGLWTFVDLIFIVLNKFEDKQGNLIIVTKEPSPFKKAMMVIGSILASALIMFILFYAIIMYATSGMVSIVNAQLNALNSGDFPRAYSYTSQRFQKATSFDEFKVFIEKFPILTHNTNPRFPNRSVSYKSGLSTGTVSGTIQSSEGVRATLNYQFVKENGNWKIEAFDVNQDASKASAATAPVGKALLPYLFDNKNVSYTTRYPQNWQAQLLEKEKGGVKLIDQQSNDIIYIESLLSKTMGGVYENSQAVVADYKKQFKKLAPDFTVIDEGSIDLPKNPVKIHGIYFIATYTYQGIPLKRIQYLFARHDGKLFYVWSFVAPQAQFDQKLGVAKEILSSFQIRE